MRRMPILCLVGLIALVGCKTNMPSYEAGNVKPIFDSFKNEIPTP
jgi:hypothetical protein